MPSREEMIKTIYDRVANKDIPLTNEWRILKVEIEGEIFGIVKRTQLIDLSTLSTAIIIGSPVMIGDVLDRIKKSPLQGFKYNRPGGNPSIHLYDQEVLHKRKEYRKPIDEQDDETIALVHLLVERTDTSD